MLWKYSSITVLFLLTVLVTAKAFLLPLLFPISIKITFHSNRKPHPPPKPSYQPDYHFVPVPVYKEVVIKGSAHISGPKIKHSYGDGHKYGTSYGDGHLKVYTEEPHIKNHKYSKGYGTGIGEHYPSQAYGETPIVHHKGTPYDDQTHYIQEEEHYKGTPYEGVQHPQTHYKGTEYHEAPQTHYKGTEYQPIPDTHYKGTEYQPVPDTHYKDTEYHEIPDTHYKGTEYRLPKGGKKKVYDFNHSFIKQVSGYKLADFLATEPPTLHLDDGTGYVSHVAIPGKIAPGHSYAEIAAAHKVSHSPKAYDSKQYTDLGGHQYDHQQGQYHDTQYLDDTLPAYKYKPTQYAERKGEVQPRVTPAIYAGYGSSVYGDSYAKMVYDPRRWKIQRRRF